MKKTLLSFFVLSLSLISLNILLSSSSNGRAFFANSGNTGAPSESTTCRSCHGTGFGTTVSVTVKDTSGNSVSQYKPGDTLDVEFKVNTSSGFPSRYGFQAVTLTSSNGAYNNWDSPSSNTRKASVGTRSYVEHNGTSSTSTFNSKWVAPTAGTGTITFYVGGAAVNNNGSTGGDGGNTTSLSLTENLTTSIEEISTKDDAKIYPNPVYDEMRIQFKNPTKKKTDIEITDVSGRLLLEQNIASDGNEYTSVNVSGLERGLYIMIVRSQGRLVYQSKFLKN